MIKKKKQQKNILEMRKVGGMKRKRDISRDEQSQMGLRKLVDVFLADSLLIYYTLQTF